MTGIIHSDTEHEAALERIEALMLSPELPDPWLWDELRLLTLVVEDYEARSVPLAPLPSPVEAIRFRMEQQGLRQVDLVPYIGSPSHVSDVLRGRRSLSLRMIRRLHAGLGIPLDVLIQEQTRPQGPKDVSEETKATP